MRRRAFLGTGLAAATATAFTAARDAAAALAPGTFGEVRQAGGRRFGLDYAPHFGMFRHHAGEERAGRASAR